MTTQNFFNDLEIGQLAEIAFTASYSHYYLTKYGMKVVNVNYSDNENRDILISTATNQTGYSYEIKYDRMAEKTGNICFEIYNSKASKPSGVMVNQNAEYIAYLIGDHFYVTTSAVLKNYITSCYEQFKKIEKVNCLAVLVPFKQFINDVQPTRIKNLLTIN